MDVGGFFFDFGAVRTDLTEMLRAGGTVLAKIPGRQGLGRARPVGLAVGFGAEGAGHLQQWRPD